jgi:hypothetical protein
MIIVAHKLDIFIGCAIVKNIRGSLIINAKHKAPVQFFNIYFYGIIIYPNNNAFIRFIQLFVPLCLKYADQIHLLIGSLYHKAPPIYGMNMVANIEVANGGTRVDQANLIPQIDEPPYGGGRMCVIS